MKMAYQIVSRPFVLKGKRLKMQSRCLYYTGSSHCKASQGVSPYSSDLTLLARILNTKGQQRVRGEGVAEVMRTGWCCRIYGVGTAKELRRKQQGTISTLIEPFSTPPRCRVQKPPSKVRSDSFNAKRDRHYPNGTIMNNAKLLLNALVPFLSCVQKTGVYEEYAVYFTKVMEGLNVCLGGAVWNPIRSHGGKTRKKTHRISQL